MTNETTTTTNKTTPTVTRREFRDMQSRARRQNIHNALCEVDEWPKVYLNAGCLTLTISSVQALKLCDSGDMAKVCISEENRNDEKMAVLVSIK